jgi:gliding motility-associated-like protein
VKLYVIDTTFCNAPFFIEQRVSLFPLVEAAFTTEPTGCVPYTAVFNNESLAGTRFIWDFGDGTTSEDFEPTKLYSNVGTYNVRLIAIDSSTCNIADTATFTIRVLDNPTAAIASWGPNPPQENTPVRFTNGSQNAVRYVWNFGDGESSTQVNPTHQYNASGTYTAELIAFNAAGCSDTATVEVNVIVVPVLDVPNAFTPGKFGENGTITVRGFGIGKMDWRIYNRWGQVVFQTNNRNAGWDGTFKGKLQPMDVYTYTLDVQFTDGTTLRRTGDITLLR